MEDGQDADILVVFGLAIRRLRTERGLSQERLAELSDLHHNYISDIERGRRNVGLRNVERLARALGLSVAELFD